MRARPGDVPTACVRREDQIDSQTGQISTMKALLQPESHIIVSAREGEWHESALVMFMLA